MGFEESPEDDGCERCSVNGQGELHVVEEGIVRGSEALVITVDSHLVMQLAGGLGWAVREDLQKVRIKGTRNKEGFTIVIVLDGPGSKQPTCVHIVLEGLVTVFLGTNGSHAQERDQGIGQRHWLQGWRKGRAEVSTCVAAEPMVNVGILNEGALLEDSMTS